MTHQRLTHGEGVTGTLEDSDYNVKLVNVKRSKNPNTLCVTSIELKKLKQTDVSIFWSLNVECSHEDRDVVLKSSKKNFLSGFLKLSCFNDTCVF